MTTYYVNADTGDNGDDGNILNPWATLSYALSNASGVTAGDEIQLRGTTFTEFVDVGISGTVGNPITITNYDGETPTLEGVAGTEGIVYIPAGRNYLSFDGDIYFSYGHAKPNGVSKFAWFDIFGSPSMATTNIILNGLSFERTGWNSGLATLAASTWDEMAVRVDGANDVTLSNLWMRGTNQGVAFRNRCLNATLTNSDIQYTVQSNVTLGTSLGVERAIFIGFNIFGRSAIEDGIQFQQDYTSRADDATDDTNRGTIIYCNEFHETSENAIDLKGTHGVIIQGNAINGTVGSNNGFDATSGNNRNSMFSIGRGANAFSHYVIIRYNIFYDNSGGFRLFPYWKAYNNTLVRNNRDYTGADSSYTSSSQQFSGARHYSSSAGAGCRNNIFSNHQDADVAYYCGQNQPTAEVDSDFNLFASSKWYDYSTNTLYTNLPAWQTRLGQNNWRYGKDANSVALPNHSAIQFVDFPSTPTGDISSYDTNLQPTSPGKAAGGWLTKTVGSGTSTTLPVVDASWFSDVFDRTDQIDRDRVFVNGQEREVTGVDTDNNELTLSSSVTWTDGLPVYGVQQGATATATPDIGAGGFKAYEGGSSPPPPPSSGTGGYQTMRVACNTSAGDQTITFPTAFTNAPVAFRFRVVPATVNDTAADGYAYGLGWAWDNSGTIVERAVAVRGAHNVNPSDTSRRTDSGHCIMLPLSNNGNIDGTANLTDITTTDITINWDDAPAAGSYLIVEAYADVSAYLGTATINDTQDNSVTVTPGFQPDFIEVATINKPIDNNNTTIRLSHGMATQASGTFTQQCVLWDSQDNVSPTQGCGYIADAYVGGEIAVGGTINYMMLLENLTSTAFDITTKLGTPGTASTGAVVFCLKFTGLGVYSGVVSTPTSTGDHNYAVGFTAGHALMIGTTLTATNTADTNGSGLSMGAWESTNGNEFSNSIADEDAVTSSDVQNISADRFWTSDFDDGAAAIRGTASASGSNLVVNFTTVDATARHAILVAIEENVVASVTADFHADTTSGAATLTVNFTDDSTEDGTTIDDWQWDFGDGGTSTSQNPSHDYDTEGVYTVTLTVSDGSVSDSKTRSAYITITAAPPAENYPSPTGVRTLVSAQMPAVAISDVQVSASVG